MKRNMSTSRSSTDIAASVALTDSAASKRSPVASTCP